MTYYNSRGVAMPETEPEQGRVAGTSAGNETINAPNAPGSSLSGEGGGDLLIGNSYGNRFWITDTRDVVQEPVNGGVDTMIGWTSLRAAANIENLQVNGAFNYAYGNALPNLIVVDDNTHWIYGAGGDDVLVGAASAKTTFVVKAGEGSDVIYNWQGNDQVQLWGYGFTSAAQVRGAMTQQGADTLLNLGGGETLTFRGVAPTAFADRQFLLPLDQSKLGALTFSDDFNSLSVWDPNTGTGTWRTNYGGNLKDPWAYTLTSNGERQVYIQPDFAGQGEQAAGVQPLTVSNGVLTITASLIPDDQRDAAWGREYYSGMVNTLGTFEQQYGYFEMRAQLPTANGTWPAFWMMPTPYVAQTEADIMEGLAATPFVDYRRAWGGGDNLYDNALKIDPTGFHNYGMLWTPQTVTFYYDGVAVLQAPTPAAWTQPMALIVNMAVGGWGGEPNSLQFPDGMKVDYVHVYNLADNSAVIERGTPELPVATLKPDGGATSGVAQQHQFFDQDGTDVANAHIAVYGAKPTDLPPGKTFVIWEDSGAVFGAVSDGHTLGTATPLMAGHSNIFTGTGAWLTDGKVALGYMAPADTGPSAWVMIFDPAHGTFTKHQLGNSTGDIDIVAMPRGNFAASWDAPDGTTHARAYDGFAYDGKGWFGPERQITGDLQGFAQNGDLIATAGSGQQLYSLNNPPPGVNAVVSIGPMAGVTHAEGNTGLTAYTFTLTRDFDLSQKSTVGWTVRGQGASPADAVDFAGGALPSGVATFEINEASTTITVYVQGDAYTEGDEQFLVTLVNPVGAKLGQATATGFIQADGDTGAAPPPPSGGGGTGPMIGFSGSSVTHAEGNSGSTAFSFTVTRSGDATASSTVNWSVAGSGTNAASASDFTGAALPSGSLTFAAGETSKTIIVGVAGDTTSESDEGFSVTLSGATGATLGTSTASGTITNDDGSAPPPATGPTVIGFTTTSVALAEGNTGTTAFSYTITRSGANTMTSTVNWSIAPDGTSRADGGDFAAGTPYGGSITFAPGEISKVLTFQIIGDTTVEGDDAFKLTLSGPTNADIGTATATGTILNDDGGASPPPTSPQIALTTATLSHPEGDTGATAFAYTVTRTGSTAGASSVNWSVGGSGANPAAAGDFAGATSGTLSFAAGETSKTITVQVAGDTAVETDEGFTVTLSGASGATLGTAAASGVIVNDDAAAGGGSGGQVYNSPGPGSTVTAGSGDDTLNASQGPDVLTGGAGHDTFAWAAAPWSPAHVTDFVVGSDKLDLSKIFQAYNYTGSNPVADKVIWLMDDGAGGTKVLFDSDGTGPNPQWPNYILNLDHVPVSGLTWAQLSGGGGSSTPPPGAPTISFGTLSQSKGEGNSGSTVFSFNVSRSGDTSASSSVSWSVAGSGANPANAADFTAGGVLPSGTLTFNPGETTRTINVNVNGDVSVESDETFTVTLSGPSNATLGSVTTSTATIGNDDQPPPSGGGTPGSVINSPGPGSNVNGTSGDDTINASQGPDVITGGAGADTFAWAAAPWSPAHVTDFVVGTDRLDLSKIFQAYNYTGSNPVADKVIWLIDDGSGGTKVLFDSDGTGPNPQWPNYILNLDHVSSAGLTWAQLSGAAGSSSPPPSTPSISLATTSVSHAEGNSGATAYSFTVLRSGDTSGASTVNWSVAGSGSSPTSGTDFSPNMFPGGQIAFSAGETSKTILVNIAGDTTVEGDETFTLTLSGPSNATLGTATATGIVTNDDGSTSSGGQVLTSSRNGDTLTGGAGADTLNAGQGGDKLTGGGGADHFVFGQAPWNAGHITDFAPGTDKIDLKGLLGRYSGSDPIADHWVQVNADGGGNTVVTVDLDGPGGDWPTTVVILDHVTPGQIGAGDWIFR